MSVPLISTGVLIIQCVIILTEIILACVLPATTKMDQAFVEVYLCLSWHNTLIDGLYI